MTKLLRQLGFVAAFAMAGIYVLAIFAGPNGWPSMIERRQDLNKIQRQNDDLEKQILHEDVVIRQLRQGGPERDHVIREKTKKQKRSETTIYFEDPSSTPK
jgi:hypothetical protein